MQAFNRFPRWMWRNNTIPPFLQWMRKWNDNQSKQNKLGFYGLDLYSLYDSIAAVIKYLNTVDPLSAQQAMDRYACFDHLSHDPHHYGFLISEKIRASCANEASKQLLEIQKNTGKYLREDGLNQLDEHHYATQNARLVKNSEHYYRALYDNGRVNSWNIRDTHMFETLQNIIHHLEMRSGQEAKIIIWAHNSHVGDARATEMSGQNELNLGQLVREHYSGKSYHIGFSTYSGTVLASDEWGQEAIIKKIRPGMAGSYEELFHNVQKNSFFLDLNNDTNISHYLNSQRLLRAIGVIYKPETERFSHYFFSQLPKQFDGIIHIDNTHALEALDQ